MTSHNHSDSSTTGSESPVRKPVATSGGGEFAHNPGKVVPDWVPSNIDWALHHPDEDLQRIAETFMYAKSEIILSEAYSAKVHELLRGSSPVGLEVPDFREFDPSRRISRSESLGELQSIAARFAEEDAEFLPGVMHYLWIERSVERLSDRYDHEDDIEGLLEGALKALNNAPHAYRVVRAWLSFKIRGHPDSWIDVQKLISDHPGLLKVGLQEMMETGFVPPPWLTTAMP